MTRGKAFETEIYKMLKTHPQIAWIYRPTDVPPMKGTRFSPPNPIDLLGYLKGGRGIVVECKAVDGRSLPFRRFFPRNEDRKRGSLTSFRQWGSLYHCWRGGIITYVAINEYGQSGRHGQRGEAHLVNFAWLREYRAEVWRKRKSWRIEDLIARRESRWIPSPRPNVIELTKVTGGWKCPTILN